MSSMFSPPAHPWPEDELEHLGRCPVCGSGARTPRFARLTDKAFGAAEGEWSMHDCGDCGIAYLDPRPDAASIGRAYARYYTHGAGEGGGPERFWRQRDLRSRLKTGFINGAYGYRFPGGIGLGYWLQRGRPLARSYADFAIRHLPAPSRPGARLLDVGCGNGDFLRVAADLGYVAVGIDPDPSAVAYGREQGLDIRPGLLPDPGFTDGGFAHVTFSHVLEHLHHPRQALEQAFAMLAPGGRIWLSQPNLEAAGLERFGASWRGLEAPRHLTLYTYESLGGLLRAIGFADVARMPGESYVADFYYRQSLAMEQGLDPYANPEPPGWGEGVAAQAQAAAAEALGDDRRCESLTMVATRP